MTIKTRLLPELLKKDLCICTAPEQPRTGMQAGAVASGVVIQHIPTGLRTSCIGHRSQYKNKREALYKLTILVSKHV